MCLVSILLPVYNAEKYIGDALESLINQSYKNIEIICVDDCSSDSSGAILKAYSEKDDRVKVYHNDINLKLSATLNKAMELASEHSKYFARMDADDVSLCDRIAIQVDHMETNPDIDLCGCFIEEFGARNREVTLPVSHIEIVGKMTIKSSSVIAHPTVMLKKSFFMEHKLKYDEGSNAEDYDLWARSIAYYNAKVSNIPIILLKYRVHENQLSTKNNIRLRRDAEKARKILANNTSKPTLVYLYIRYHNYKSSIKNIARVIIPEKIYLWIKKLWH